MSAVEVEQKSYEMPPREGITIAHFLTVATSAGRLVSMRRSRRAHSEQRRQPTGAPAYIQIAEYLAPCQRRRRADSR